MAIRTTKRPAGEPTWFDLMTPDLDEAKHFYQKVFGWSYIDMGADFGHYHFAQTQNLNVAGLGPMPPDTQMPSAWTVYFASDDATVDVACVKALGGQVITEAFPVGDSGIMAICADPTGAVFGLWQTISHIGASIENEHGTMSWCEVNTRDSDAACSFYCKLFHLTAHKMENTENMEYHIFQRGKENICGILQMNDEWEGIPPHWLCYFAVDDTDAAIMRATAAGGQVRIPAFDIDYGRIAVLSDPYNAAFCIIKLASIQ